MPKSDIVRVQHMLEAAKEAETLTSDIPSLIPVLNNLDKKAISALQKHIREKG